MSSDPAILWQIQDDKPGHRNQLRGLTSAMAELRPLAIHTLRSLSRRNSLRSLWSKTFLPGAGLPPPDLILGAGHRTHLAVLAARRAYGGQAIVLMKPTLPPALFDLCLIPKHDQVASSARVLTTRGVLNVIRPTKHHSPQSGLFLIGGPSAAHSWSDKRILEQLEAITSSHPSVHWDLTTSRRTPASFLARLKSWSERVATKTSHLRVTPHEATNAEWVPQQLAQASQVWVSEDSVSMVYEALTSGAAVGVLDVPEKRRGRVAAGMENLIEAGWATRFCGWQHGSRLAPPPRHLDEARRCAEFVCQQLLSRSAA